MRICSSTSQIPRLYTVVPQEDVKADPEKVKPITQYSAPTNIKELERFLGMTGVYIKSSLPNIR